MPDYSVKPGVVIDPKTRRFVAAIAADFSKPLVVTSGYRGPEKQASAMYTKFKVGGSYQIYRQHAAAKAVYDAYAEGIQNKATRSDIIRQMADVMRAQIKKGVYLSNHMHATAIDFRTRNLSRSERAELEKVCRKHHATVVLLEGHPPHLHVQF